MATNSVFRWGAVSWRHITVTVYGQEMDNATTALAKMNVILHDNPTAESWKDNTLSGPHCKQANGDLKTFDFAVANPPFSSKAWSNDFDPANDEYDRFEFGIPPAKNGDCFLSFDSQRRFDQAFG